MDGNLLVAGAGIGGLSCALSMGLSGVPVTVLKQADDFTELGAGVQLGPNAMRVLSDWGLDERLRSIASYPNHLCVRDSLDGRQLGHLRLGATALARFGQPYAGVHRADLHQLLLEALRSRTRATLRLQARVKAFEIQSNEVRVQLEEGVALSASALIGCDGLWSRVREVLLGTEPAQSTGHLAYRGLIPADSLPRNSRSNSVQVWLGANMHVVSYPVRSGQWINLVAMVHGRPGASAGRWTQETRVENPLNATGPVAANLRALIDAVPRWTLCTLHDRAPLHGPSDLARGPVALLGDAALSGGRAPRTDCARRLRKRRHDDEVMSYLPKDAPPMTANRLAGSCAPVRSQDNGVEPPAIDCDSRGRLPHQGNRFQP